MEFHGGVRSSEVKTDYVCCTPSVLLFSQAGEGCDRLLITRPSAF